MHTISLSRKEPIHQTLVCLMITPERLIILLHSSSSSSWTASSCLDGRRSSSGGLLRIHTPTAAKTSFWAARSSRANARDWGLTGRPRSLYCCSGGSYGCSTPASSGSGEALEPAAALGRGSCDDESADSLGCCWCGCCSCCCCSGGS